MAKTTKEGQRAELHKTIWRIANDLRGSVDGWDFKSYVLGMLFYRFISENLEAYINEGEREAGDLDFDYASLGDSDAEFGRADTVAEKGFYILPSELFVNVRERAPHDENLNETLERVFKNIERSAFGTDSEDDLNGLFDDLDVNSAKLGPSVAKRNERLVKLLDAIGDLDLGDFSDHTIDAFGDAYEYLMTMYASAAGKSGGEFFTPQEVSELLARITVLGKTSVNKVYDPACGSGSLLLKFAKVLGKENVRQGFYGQEINLTTYNLARINMFLHDINFEKFDIAHGDTLIDPAHWDDEPFEAIVSNPPYSTNWDGDSDPLLMNDPRFSPAGILAPKDHADLAFTMHILHWLAVNGTAAIVEYPGVLSRAGAERKIRKFLIDNNYIDTVIQLPPDLFFGTPVRTCIIVLKKSKKDSSVLFVDASLEFKRIDAKNQLTATSQQRILDALEKRIEVPHFASLVSNVDLSANGYNLSPTTYVERARSGARIDASDVNSQIRELERRASELRRDIASFAADQERDESYLTDLIAGQCPNGVPFVPLGELLAYEQPGKYLVASTAYDDSYPTPVLTAGQTFILGYTNETTGIYPASPTDPVIIFDDFTTAFKWVDFPFKAKSSAMKMLRPKRREDRALFRFVYFAMLCIDFQPQEHSRHWISRYANFTIPVPPITVQQEIIRSLNFFTSLNDEMRDEFKARRHQFEYYRRDLLTFEELADD